MKCESDPVWLERDRDLQSFNTLGLSAHARFFAEVKSLDALQGVLVWARQQDVPVLPLGGGSNVVLVEDFPGLVIRIGLLGCHILEEYADAQDSCSLVQASAGENWDDFVGWTLKQGFSGLENLSLIPGCVGAAPIQNIGAYGVEIKDCFHSLEAVEVATGKRVSMATDACGFGYRDSVFKRAERDRLIITSVTFSLSRTFSPCLGYGHLQKEVQAAASGDPVTAELVSEVVCRIRNARLPDPDVIGNAGSFFKNPVVIEEHYQRLAAQEAGLVAFPAGKGYWKLAAGWLIDQCGFKGAARESGAGVYDHQALVLVNRGGASGQDILALAAEICAAVQQRFGVELEIEPRVY